MKKSSGALSRFRDAMHREGECAGIPSFETILSRGRRAKASRPRWVFAAAAALVLAAIPAYERIQRLNVQQRDAEREKADALLMEQVNAGISRSVPRAMTVLVDWAPGN